MLRNIAKPRLTIDLGFAIGMVKSTCTFLGIDGIIAVKASLLIILLSKLTDEITFRVF